MATTRKADPIPTPTLAVDNTGEQGEQRTVKKNPFADVQKLRTRNKTLLEGSGGDTTSVSIGAPPRDKFFRCPKDDIWFLPAMVWADPQDRRRIFYIDEGLWQLSDLQGAIRPSLLAPWMLTDGALGMWAISTQEGGSGGDWRDSAIEAIRKARLGGWIRVQSDMNVAKKWLNFDPHEPIADLDWPADLTPERFYTQAFGKRMVLDVEHSLIRRLRGLPEI